MAQYFLIPEPLAELVHIQLDSQRSHYLCRVLRKRRGDQIECIDGRGGIWRAVVDNDSAKRAAVQVLENSKQTPAPDPQLAVGLSLIKGAGMDRALQQSVELGANQIYLIAARRSNVVLDKQRLDNKIQHWQRIMEGACEQSGQLWLPTLHAPQSLASLVTHYDQEIILLTPDGAPFPQRLADKARLLLIGPEGGWDDQELALATHQSLFAYSLGERILRAETTPAVALALAQHAQSA